MKFGWLKEVKKGVYRTENGKITLTIKPKNGHLHIAFTGAYRKSGLSNIHDRVNRVELAVIANHFYTLLNSEGYVSTSDIGTNYASIFGSCFSIGAREAA